MSDTTTGRRNRRTRAALPQFTREQIERAIYIDFEGTKVDLPSFLGWYCEGQWGFFITEEGMHTAASYPHAKGSGTASTLTDACRAVMHRAVRERRPVMAWSTHELTTILALDSWTAVERDWWTQCLINALPIGKQWARRNRVKVPVVEGQWANRPNKWSLSGFRMATAYPKIHALHEPGHTAQRLRHVRQQLDKRGGDFSRLTRVAKGKWTKVLTHNYHDCAGLAHVMDVVYTL